MTKEQEMHVLQSTSEKNKYVVKSLTGLIVQTLHMRKITEKETQIYRTVFWTLWEKARVGCFRRTASKHVCYLG